MSEFLAQDGKWCLEDSYLGGHVRPSWLRLFLFPPLLPPSVPRHRYLATAENDEGLCEVSRARLPVKACRLVNGLDEGLVFELVFEAVAPLLVLGVLAGRAQQDLRTRTAPVFRPTQIFFSNTRWGQTWLTRAQCRRRRGPGWCSQRQRWRRTSRGLRGARKRRIRAQEERPLNHGVSQ